MSGRKLVPWALALSPLASHAAFGEQRRFVLLIAADFGLLRQAPVGNLDLTEAIRAHHKTCWSASSAGRGALSPGRCRGC